MNKGVAAHCATEGEIINLADAYDCEHFSQDMDKKTGYRTKGMLCVPVFDGPRQLKVAAVLQTINKLDGRPFDDSDINLLGDFVAHAQIALRNARRYERVSSRYKQVLEEQVMQDPDYDDFEHEEVEEVDTYEAAALSVAVASSNRRAKPREQKDSRSISFANIPIDSQQVKEVAQEQIAFLERLQARIPMPRAPMPRRLMVAARRRSTPRRRRPSTGAVSSAPARRARSRRCPRR